VRTTRWYRTRQRETTVIDKAAIENQLFSLKGWNLNGAPKLMLNHNAARSEALMTAPMAISADRIDTLATQLMAVIDGDPASPLEATIALLTVAGANLQRGPVLDRELSEATEAYDMACGGILRRQLVLSGVRPAN
jgi:hypothetical protein